jgi:hypothetical protein
MPEMSQEERVVCALSREEPDRVPLYDLVDNTAVIEHYAGQKLTLENAQDVIPLALSRVMDTTRVWMPAAPGRRVDERGFVHERRDWFNEWQVQTPFHDMPGLIAFVRSEIERLEAWQPSDPQGHLKELLDWKERFRGTVIPASGAGEALQEAYITIGLDWFVYLEAEDAELTRRWIEALHTQTMRRLESEAGCRAVSPVAWAFSDLAYKGHLMFSPAYLHDHRVFHHLAEICDLYHSYGLKVIFHSDGYIRPIVPDLIAAGVDALAPIETSAGLDLADLKAEFGHQVAFVGGVDLNVLSYGSVEDVRQVTLRALAAAGPGGGFILGSSSEELYDALPAENVITMFETTRECGRYPIKLDRIDKIGVE